MEKIMAAIFLSTLLSSMLLLAAAADPVLDYRSNNVTADASYYIEINAAVTVFQKLSLSSINGSCARYAAYSFLQPGVPVRFRPFLPGNTLQVGDGYRFGIEFTSAPDCAGSGQWTVDDSSSYVVVGADDANATTTAETRYFAVLRDAQSGKYTLGDCGTCAVCKNLCRPIGLERMFMKTDAANPLNVYFRKAVARPN